MSDKINLKVNKRKITGRKVKKLRTEGLVPANIYGKDVKSIAIELPSKDFISVYKQAGETGIIYLTVKSETKTRPVLINNLHTHPVTDQILHADFRQVDLTKKVTVNIPVEITGKAPAAETGGVLVNLLSEVEVEALPTDLPDKFELDISKLEEIGQGLTLKDIKLDTKKVKLTSENLDEIIVQVEAPAKEEEKPVEEEVEAEEGEEAAEGEAKEGEAKPEEGKPEDQKPDSKEGQDKKEPEPKKEEKK